VTGEACRDACAGAPGRLLPYGARFAKPFKIRDFSIKLAWNDAMTGLESRSLGAGEHRMQLSAVGLFISSEYLELDSNGPLPR